MWRRSTGEFATSITIRACRGVTCRGSWGGRAADLVRTAAMDQSAADDGKKMKNITVGNAVVSWH
jgi:hypothetical protein